MRLGSFELIAPLGQGGMGAVWRGRHRQEGTEAAIKVMHAEMMGEESYRDAFETEVRSVAALSHRHIVTILDVGTVPKEVAARSEALVANSPFLVMELAHGGSVEDYVNRVTWPDTRQLLLTVLDALAHAHARQVVHRDLKPENILVGCGPGWDVKLTDFGLAHAADHFEDGKVETAWGTPQYMAPEQLRGLWRHYGPWTDIYALGCMAYELVCGRWPYGGETVWEIGEGHLEKEIPPVTPRFEVPPGTESWIRNCIAKRRGERFQRAADAAYHLAQLAALEDRHHFGVLFNRPSGGEEPPTEGDSGEVVATQVIPQQHLMGRADLGDAKTREGPPASLEALESNWPRAQRSFERPPMPHDWRCETNAYISNELIGISLNLFGLRSIPLIDREAERDALWEQLQAVSSEGRARQILVEGQAGVGKTKLVRWLSRRAQEVGAARVARAHHSAVTSANDGLVAMLERKLRCRHLGGKDRRDHLVQFMSSEGLAATVDMRMVLALLGDTEAGSRESGAALSKSDRYAVIYQLLMAMSRLRPLILVLDDIAWGRDALGFAQYMEARQDVDPAPILVVMTARPSTIARRPTIEEKLEAHLASSYVERWTLSALDEKTMKTLLERLLRLQQSVAKHVLRRADGVPLFAIQLVDDWVARGKLEMGPGGFSLREGADISIPDDLHQLWEERIRGFLATRKPEAARHLELGAAFGRQVDAEAWRAAIDAASLPPLSRLVEQLVDEGMAFRRDEGWQFAHGMLRESLVRRAVEGGRWQRWQRHCAESLEELAARSPGRRVAPRRIAWHWKQAGEPMRAATYLGKAVEEAIWGADYEEAQELVDRRREWIADRQALVLRDGVDRARLAAHRGDYKASLKWIDGIQDRARQSGERDRAEVLLWKGLALRALGHLQLAEEALEEGLAGASMEGGELEARLLLERGRVEEQRGRFEGALDYFERAREAYEALDNAYGQGQALNAIGDAHRRLRHYERAHRASLQALALFRELDNISGIADCLNDLAELSRMKGEFGDARQFGQESLRLYRALGSRESSFVALNLAMIELEQKRWEEAAERFLEVHRAFEREGRRAMEMRAKAGLLAANAGRGQWVGFMTGLRELAEHLALTSAYSPTISKGLSVALTHAQEAGRDKAVTAINQLLQRFSGTEEPC